MEREPNVIVVADGGEIACLLAETGRDPLVLDYRGVRYRVVLENPDRIPWSESDEAEARAVRESAIGSWADLDADALIEAVYRARDEGSRPATRP